MGSANDSKQPSRQAPVPLKIVVAGGFGAGKTTLVGAVSEIEPLLTEELLSAASSTADSLNGVEAKTTTTVSMDFGRITLEEPEPPIRLHLFGTPGQDRFLFTWDDLAHGAIGAIVLADTRRLPDSFTAVEYFLKRKTPFVVAVNEFADASFRYSPDEVRDALELPEQTPVLLCDARKQGSVVTLLFALVHHALANVATHQPTPVLGAH